ncbi:hypothetical protein ACQY0O_007454 [Thecaphora frezii]
MSATPQHQTLPASSTSTNISNISNSNSGTTANGDHHAAPARSPSTSAQPPPKARIPSAPAQHPRKSLVPPSSASPRTRKVSSGPTQHPRASSSESRSVSAKTSRPSLANPSSTTTAQSTRAGSTQQPQPPTQLHPDVDDNVTKRVGFEPRGSTRLGHPAALQKEAIVWLDIDNTLYKRSTRIAELMGERIRAYFVNMGLDNDEARQLHQQYYKTYGLAIRGLVKHHDIDPLDYDRKCDASLPLEDILRPDPDVIRLLSDLDRTKVRVFALTNAYKQHADRVLRLLGIDDQVEGIVYCDYAVPDFSCKPELDFYQAALRLVGAGPDTRSYFVDDSALNIVAAKQLGWHSCVYFKEDDDDEQQWLPDLTEQDEQAARDFDATVLAPRAVAAPNGGVARQSYFDEEAIQAQFRKLPAHMRIRLLSIILDACLPGDIASMARTLERHLRMTRDLVSHLPDSVALKVFEKLPVQDLLRCRQVSKKWLALAATPELWRSHALALTEGDPVKVQPPPTPEGWEPLVKGLFFRERNWGKGIAQRIDLFEGHTGFVTSIKLKGRKTLVTGSYDETIRVWDLSTGVCKKVLKAKAIACLDFLLDEGILCAGLYDSGRVMVWDMKTGELLQTLSGHNRGIRNVALNQDYLVSVGQDKAIVVWDWKTGTKIVRFGQQSNVSLGVQLVDKDKLVAVTVDGVIRCFSIRRKEMVGQFHLTRLGDASLALGSRLGDLGSGANMLEWFAAHGNTMTVASKNLVVHLEWQEHVVPVVEDEVAWPSSSDALRRSASSRLSINSLATTPVRSRVRRDSAQSTASLSGGGGGGGGTRTPLSPEDRRGAETPTRLRKDSTASNASAASAATASSSVRRSASGNANFARSPPQQFKGRREVVSPSLSTPSRPSPAGRNGASSFAGRKLAAPTPWPLAGAASQLESPVAESPVEFPSRPRVADDAAGAAAASPTMTRATRFAPNLTVAPRVVSILETPDMATGCVDASKRRIVCATRFSSRTGADRRLYTSSLAFDLGQTSKQLNESSHSTIAADAATATANASNGETAPTEAGEREQEPPDSQQPGIAPIVGAWQARAAELQTSTRNPMAMVLDHESVVVGCADGTVYRIGFVGSEYSLEPRPAENGEEAEEVVGDATIKKLEELRTVWSEIFVPIDAPPDHPGRKRRDLVRQAGFK